MNIRNLTLAAFFGALFLSPQAASPQILGKIFGPRRAEMPDAAAPAAIDTVAPPLLAPSPTVRVPDALAGPSPGWRRPDPENTLVIDTTKGQIIAELDPILAPAHVERIKRLARAQFYDGLKFFRVIDEFMAQTGDPQNNGEGASALPDLNGEFSFRRRPTTPFTPLISAQGFTGFVSSVPIQSQPDAQMAITADGAVPASGLFCPGVLGMARGSEDNSANSQFFLMRQTYPSLNGNYTVFGRVLSGLNVVRAIKVGEPPSEPMDVMIKVRMLADIPAAERPKIVVMETTSPEFRTYAEGWRKAQGANVDICKLDIPVSVE